MSKKDHLTSLSINQKNISPQPMLIVISGPSGVGKSTLCSRLINEQENIKYSISCTTRKPRKNEEDGVNYFFLSEKEFNDKIKSGEFLEHAIVHDHQYGTLQDSILFALKNSHHIILDIDPQGAEQIRKAISKMNKNDLIVKAYTDIFIMPPSLMDLESRLSLRNTENKKDIKRRIMAAAKEIESAPLYQYKIINTEIDKAYEELLLIIEGLS